MKNFIYILALLLSLNAVAQQKSFEITNKLNGKTSIIEENERVKLRTLDGKKHVGELHFSQTGELQINDELIKIDSIKSIKKQPTNLATIKKIALYTGLALVGTSLIVAAGGGNAAFLLLTTGTGVCIGAGILEALNSNSTAMRNDFKIIEK